MFDQQALYVGSSTSKSATAIRVFAMSGAAQAFEQTSSIDTVEHASFLAVHPNRRVLYAVSEVTSFAEKQSGGINTFAIDPGDASLTLISQVLSHGLGPCHMSVDPTSNHLFVANYVSGSFVTYRLHPDGMIGPLAASHQGHGNGPTDRQDGPHAHCIVPGPTLADGTRSVYGVDLGTDRIIQFRDTRNGSTSAMIVDDKVSVAAGAGPRHVTFHPSRPLAFIACELDSTLITADVDLQSGRLNLRTSHPTLPPCFADRSTVAEVQVHPNGRFVYVSNRGHDSIAVFELDAESPALLPRGTIASGGKNPRHFAIDRSGQTMVVANEHSDSLAVFRIDATNGSLHPTGEVIPAVGAACALFSEAAR